MLFELPNALAISLQTIFNHKTQFSLFQSPTEMTTSSKAPKEVSVDIKTTTTKTKALTKISELPPFTTLFAPMTVGNQQYIPEPKTEEQRRIYASQVLIPVSVSGKKSCII